MSELHSVVLTGLGAITTRGDVTLQTGRNAFDENTASGNYAITEFKIETYLSSQKTYLDRCTALALGGCALALRDAGIEWPIAEHGFESREFGITLGTHLGCVETMKSFWDKAMERGVRVANPLLFSHSYFNTPISLCAIEFGLRGYHTTFCAGHASGMEAVRAAYDAIRLGHATTILAGGVEALTPTHSQCTSDDSDTPLGEAAVFFLLEAEAAANARHAPAKITVQDQLLNQAQTQTSAVRSLFGDCGGAESTLSLAAHLVKQIN